MSCLVLLSTASLFGQATATASLQGTITDKSQAVIGNKAEVTITNKETGATRTANTNDAGEYKLSRYRPAGIRLRQPPPDFPPQKQKTWNYLWVERQHRISLCCQAP